jgi:hypothetical protein
MTDTAPPLFPNRIASPCFFDAKISLDKQKQPHYIPPPIDNNTVCKDLHAKIGQLSMENDFLSGAFGCIGDAIFST